MEKTFVTEGCLGLLNSKYRRWLVFPPTAVNPSIVCLVVLTFCRPSLCRRAPERFQTTHTLESIHKGVMVGSQGTQQKISKSSDLKMLLPFRGWGAWVVLKLCLCLGASKLAPKENLSSGQEAQITCKDDYSRAVLFMSPLTCPSMLSPRGQHCAHALGERNTPTLPRKPMGLAEMELWDQLCW